MQRGGRNEIPRLGIVWPLDDGHTPGIRGHRKEADLLRPLEPLRLRLPELRQALGFPGARTANAHAIADVRDADVVRMVGIRRPIGIDLHLRRKSNSLGLRITKDPDRPDFNVGEGRFLRQRALRRCSDG